MHTNGFFFTAAPSPEEAFSGELEAAEALAGLAQLSEMREKAGTGASESWGNKGKRAMKRVKSESPPVVDSVLKSVAGCSRDLDLTTHQEGTYEEPNNSNNVNEHTVINPVGGEENALLHKNLPKGGNMDTSFGPGRSRNNLTEAEKEARRIRRILANRESARQTIRRRQALYEELNKRAVELSSENEKLKRDKELALKEYQSLEVTNKHLKAQVTKAMKAKVEVVSAEHKFLHVNASTPPSANCQLLMYNRIPLMPACWPPVIQSSDTSQLQNQPQSQVFIPANIPLSASGMLNTAQEQESSVNFNVPRTPYYVVPYPWFFPLPDAGNGIYQQPSNNLQNVQDEASVDNQYSASSSSKNIAHVESHNSSFPLKIKGEASSLVEAKNTTDLNEVPIEFHMDGVRGIHTKEVDHFTMPENVSGAKYTVRCESRPQSDCAANIDVNLTKASMVVSSIPEMNREPASHSSKKIGDAVAAAEARKRRKELTKLKNIHGRQCRIPF